MAIKNGKKLKVLSLFSGIGGLDLGFKKAGFEVVATVEWDKDCCRTLRINKDTFFDKETTIIEADITKIQPEEIYSGKVDFFIGGPPCQTFSAIGRRAGGANGRLDDRGNLFKHYCRLLRHFRPEGFMFENVRGILSSNKGQDWKDVLKEFSSLGYKLKYRVLDTAGYGVAQHRERVILVGYRPNYNFFFPRPTHGPDSNTNSEFVSASEALHKVNHTESAEALYNINGKYDELLKEIPAGSNYLFLTEEMGHPNPKFAWRSKFSDFLYKAHPDLPIKTIVARMGRYSGPFHWEGRRLSVGELLRLQGFPDGYKLCGSRVSKIKQIGNSVVPLFSFPLACAVKATIFNARTANVVFLNDDEVLSIDKRKGLKAKKTRGQRANYSQNQLSIFDNNFVKIAVPNIRLKSAQYYFKYPSPVKLKVDEFQGNDSEFDLNIKVNNSTIEVTLSSTSMLKKPDAHIVEMELSLSSQSMQPIKELIFKSDWYESARPYVIWDAINIAIASVSPFPSLHELYGHFTEPNPKFTIRRFKVAENCAPITRLVLWMSDVRNTMGTQPISLLKQMGFNIDNQRTLLEGLREKRIDIRTNLTNKRIDAGKFRVCYPFTLPIDKKSFITIAK